MEGRQHKRTPYLQLGGGAHTFVQWVLPLRHVRLDIVVEHLARLWVQMLLPLIVQLLLERRIITGNHRNAL